MAEITTLPGSAFTPPGCRGEEEEEGKMLSAHSLQNNEGGRLLQWGAGVVNM